MSTAQYVSVVCLSLVALMCAAGIFCRHFHENWPQLLGLAGLATWAAARVLQITDFTDHRVPNQGAFMHISLALYGLGTAIKVWRNRPRNGATPVPPAPAPHKIEPEQLRSVAGGSGE